MKTGLKVACVINEETSGITGCTVYDFNGDGASEVVYRDEQYLYIINGNNGSSIHSKVYSAYQFEYPVVADVDADGANWLCITCGLMMPGTGQFCDLNYSTNSRAVFSIKLSTMGAFAKGLESALILQCQRNDDNLYHT